MHIFIFQTGEPMPNESFLRPMRASMLAKTLSDRNIPFTIVTSNFNHSLKKFRFKTLRPWIRENNILYINSFGYSRNISLQRLIDHASLSLNLLLCLIIRLRFFSKSVVFVGYPPIEWAFVVTLFSRLCGSRVFLDVKDLWPDLFYSTPNRLANYIVSILATPYKILRTCTLKFANYICIPSPQYASHWFCSDPSLPHKLITVPLVSSITTKFPSRTVTRSNSSHELRLIFVGSLMQSAYDFLPVFLALKHFKGTDSKIFLDIVGDGPLLQDLRKSVAAFDISSCVSFHGWQSGVQLDSLYRSNQFGIAPYRNISNFCGHFPNKLTDYLKNSLGIVSTTKPPREFNNNSPYLYNQYTTADDLIALFPALISLSEDELSSLAVHSFNHWQTSYNPHTVYNNLVNQLLSCR